MHNTNREMETLRKNQNEMLEVKNSVTETKNAFDGLSTKERISELEGHSVETYKTNPKKQKKRNKNQNRTFKNYGTISKYVP